MNAAESLQNFRAEFKEALQEKTGWGRNELMQKVDECIMSVLSIQDATQPTQKENQTPTPQLESFTDRMVLKDENGNKISLPLSLVVKTENTSYFDINGFEYALDDNSSKILDEILFDDIPFD